MPKIIVGTREAAECNYQQLPSLLKSYLRLMVQYDKNNPKAGGIPLEQIVIVRTNGARVIISETQTEDNFSKYKLGLLKTNGLLAGHKI